MPEVQYSKGCAKDLDEIVDLLNYIFSHDVGRHDFPSLLPILYQKGSDAARHHYIARMNGRIVATVGCFPINMSILGEPLRVGRIGNVAVHPYHRDEGHMKALMGRAVNDMESAGTAFGVLGGQRQRYEYFGFEPAGTSLDFYVTAANLRHFLHGCAGSDLSFIEMAPESGAMLRQAQALQQQGPLYCERPPEDFFTICRSWNSRPFYILKQGVCRGYMVCTPDFRRMLEIGLDDDALIPDALAAMLARFGTDSVALELPPYETRKIAVLQAFCEGVSISAAKSFYIMDFERVVRPLLRLKSSCGQLCDGKIILDIAGCGRLSLCCREQKTAVSLTDEPADLALSRQEAMNVLFAPLGAFYEYARFPGALCGCAASWFPLPLWMPAPDRL